MKIKSELRKMKVRNTFIKIVGEANLTWEEKVALRDAVRKIVEKEGVKKNNRQKRLCYNGFR